MTAYSTCLGSSSGQTVRRNKHLLSDLHSCSPSEEANIALISHEYSQELHRKVADRSTISSALCSLQWLSLIGTKLNDCSYLNTALVAVVSHC